MNVGYLDIEKKLSVADEAVANFAKNIDIPHVVCGKYLSLLFGKRGWTDNISILIEKVTFDKFARFFNNLSKNSFHFERDKEDLFEDLIDKKIIKVYWKELPIPYLTLSFTHTKLDKLSLETSVIIILEDERNKFKINIRAPELEIPYLLAKDKKSDDSIYLYKLFSDQLDKKLFAHICRKFKVNINKYIS